jgi:hypothetical protein
MPYAKEITKIHLGSPSRSNRATSLATRRRIAFNRWHLIEFLYRQRFSKPRIPDTPAFDVESDQYFATRLPKARIYLE